MLSVKNLSVYYGMIKAVDNINFKVPAGKVVSIIGSNGAGKTSTLNAILNIPKRTGEINFLGYEIERHKTHTLVQKGISLVPEGRRIFANLSIEDNLKMGGFYNADNYEHLKNQMYKLFPRLKQKNNTLARNLSGGEAQMLAISRALMGEPKLLMLDEPSLGLAPKIVGEVFEIIQVLKNEGITILLVEQNAHLALKISDYAYVLENGKIAMQGEGKVLANDSDVRKKYLGI